MPTAANVLAGSTGGLYLGPVGTTLPVDPVTPIHGDFDELGYLGEEGVTQTIGQQRNEIRAWQNGDTVRKVRTQHDVTYSFTLLEFSPEALAAYYGADNVSGTAGDLIVEIRGDASTRGPWVLQILDAENHVRIVIPDGEVTEQGAVPIVNGDAIKHPLVVTAYPDEDGVKAYIYSTNAGIDSA